MKTLIAAVILAGTIGIGVGTAAQAEEKKAPEPGTWRYQVALETGALPASESVKMQKESGRTGASVPAIEVGGIVYRIGIDTY